MMFGPVTLLFQVIFAFSIVLVISRRRTVNIRCFNNEYLGVLALCSSCGMNFNEFSMNKIYYMYMESKNEITSMKTYQKSDGLRQNMTENATNGEHDYISVGQQPTHVSSSATRVRIFFLDCSFERRKGRIGGFVAMDAGDVLTCRIHDPHSAMWTIGGRGVVEAGAEIELTKKKKTRRETPHTRT